MATTKLNITADAGMPIIVLTRAFDAPRALVFKAFTDPAAIPRWWGPRSSTTTVDAMDARAGGGWRYVCRDPDGSAYAFHGVYHDVVVPERVVFTFEFDGVPGHVLLETVTFEERDGKTHMTDTSVFQSVEDRDGMIASGMEEGATESMDRLEEYVRAMA